MNDKAKRNWGIAIVLIIIIWAIWYFTKKKTSSNTQLSDADFLSQNKLKYGLTDAEANAFLKSVKCIENSNNIFQDAAIRQILSFPNSGLAYSQLQVSCGLSPIEVNSLTTASKKITPNQP